MSATSIGGLIGAAIDAASGKDSPVDGAIEGMIAANVIKVALPLVATYAVGWAVLRGAGALKERVFGGGGSAAASG